MEILESDPVELRVETDEGEIFVGLSETTEVSRGDMELSVSDLRTGDRVAIGLDEQVGGTVAQTIEVTG